MINIICTILRVLLMLYCIVCSCGIFGASDGIKTKTIVAGVRATNFADEVCLPSEIEKEFITGGKEENVVQLKTGQATESRISDPENNSSVTRDEPIPVMIKTTSITEKPEDFTVCQTSLNTVRMSWKAVDGAEYYELFRDTNSTGTWSKVKNIYQTTVNNLNLTQGNSYSYKIRAVAKIDGAKVYGPFSDKVDVMILSGKTKELHIEKITLTSVKLSWNALNGATKYHLYRRLANETSWSRVKTVKSTSTTNLNLISGNTYQYKVCANIETPYGSYLGAYSDIVSIALQEETSSVPVISRIQQMGTNKVYLEWNPVRNAIKYNLYRSDNNGKWVKIKSTDEPSVMNLALNEGVSYRYRVTAVCQNSSKEMESDVSDAVVFSLGDGLEAITDLDISFTDEKNISLSWSDNSGRSEGYTLFRKENGGQWSKMKNTTAFFANNIEQEMGSICSYSVRSYAHSDLGIYYSLLSNIPVFWNQKVSGLSIEGNNASWKSVEQATSYVIYADNNKIGTSKTNTFLLDSSYYGSMISISAVCRFEGDNVESLPSDKVMFNQSGKTVYRALLIGETTYTSRLNGPENDIRFMGGMLRGLSNHFEVCSQQNATLDEIVDLIDVAFEGATNDDVSLFYYSGHGVTGAGEYYSGALQTVDYGYLTMGDLAELLSNVPGRVIVILDSCGSGSAISDGSNRKVSTAEKSSCKSESKANSSDDSSDAQSIGFNAEQFNTGVIESFSAVDSTIISKPGRNTKSMELKQTKFHVITSSAYEENSLTTMIDGIWGGILTKGIAYATGCSYPDGIYSGSMPADINADYGISFSELKECCQDYAGDRQTVLGYSASPDYVFFRR